MLLAIDIANKDTNFGIFDGQNLAHSFSIRDNTNKSTDEIRLIIKLILADKGIDLADIKDIIISSVVPELANTYTEISRTITGKDPMIIGPGVKTGINIKCESPKEVGSDRIIRALAASLIHEGDLLVISAASITTIDYINSKKEFLGGLILPGIDLFEDALRRQSAKLPQVEIKKSASILGNNTVTSIQNGIYYGYQKALSGIIDEIMGDYGLADENIQIITSGNFASFLDLGKRPSQNHPDLSLVGLRAIYELNTKPKA